MLILVQDWDDYRIYNLYTAQEIHEGEEITLNYDN
jgi:hypothetical protein